MKSADKKYQISTFKQDKGPIPTRKNRFKNLDFSHRKTMDASITCLLQLFTSDLYVQVDERGQLQFINTNKEKVIFEQNLNLRQSINGKEPERVLKMIQTMPGQSNRLFLMSQFRVWKFEIRIG